MYKLPLYPIKGDYLDVCMIHLRQVRDVIVFNAWYPKFMDKMITSMRRLNYRYSAIFAVDCDNKCNVWDMLIYIFCRFDGQSQNATNVVVIPTK